MVLQVGMAKYYLGHAFDCEKFFQKNLKVDVTII